jgi:anti-sigma B factor antagonist
MSTVRYSPSQAVITLESQVLGGVQASEFSTQIQTLAEDNVSLIVVDMTHVQVMNSSGLGMLVAAQSAMRKFASGVVVFANVPDKVKTLLKMTHLDKVFPMYDSTDSALTHSAV